MKVTRFTHVSVNSDGTPLEGMLEFYRDVLGLGDRPRPEIPGVPGHWLAVGGQELHLVGAAPSGIAPDPVGNHFCLAVDDLDVAIAELEARRIEYRRAVQGEHTVQIWFADPAGNTIELQQETNPA